jgi:sRNA-binding carbon storage regulator CsrA
MLALSRKNQESVAVGAPHDNESILTVTVIEFQARRIHPGSEAGQYVRIQRSDLVEQTPVADEKLNRPPTNEVAANEAIDRWEDDGGRKDALVAVRAPVTTRPPDVTRPPPVLIERGREIMLAPNRATIGPQGFHVSRAAGLGALLVATAVLAMATYSLALTPTVEVPAAAGVDRNAAVTVDDVSSP